MSGITRSTVIAAIQTWDHLILWLVPEDVSVLFNPRWTKPVRVSLDPDEALEEFYRLCFAQKMRGILVKSGIGLGGLICPDGTEKFICDQGHTHHADTTAENWILERSILFLTEQIDALSISGELWSH